MQYESTIANTPRVFIEFPDAVPFAQVSKDMRRAPLKVRLHVVTQAMPDASGAIKDTTAQAHEATAANGAQRHRRSVARLGWHAEQPTANRLATLPPPPWVDGYLHRLQHQHRTINLALIIFPTSGNMIKKAAANVLQRLFLLGTKKPSIDGAGLGSKEIKKEVFMNNCRYTTFEFSFRIH